MVGTYLVMGLAMVTRGTCTAQSVSNVEPRADSNSTLQQQPTASAAGTPAPHFATSDPCTYRNTSPP